MESIPAKEVYELSVCRRLLEIHEGNPTVYKVLPEGVFNKVEMVGFVNSGTSIQSEVLNNQGDFEPLVQEANPTEWLSENLAKLKGVRVKITVETRLRQEVNKRGKTYLEATQLYKDFTALKPVSLADGKAKINFVTFTNDALSQTGGVMDRHYYAMLKVNEIVVDPPLSEDGKILSKTPEFESYVKMTGLPAEELKDIIRQAEWVRLHVKDTLHLYGLNWVSEKFFDDLTKRFNPSLKVEVIE